ncbi:23S rRNA (uracil(1939)-C(5))-methyltransferase RlmD [Lactococcus hircilactis]|uniref:23S rRNA (Uracil(1939)-C(5))-methyltransferase RlmD n=1 Tax=Lactococcus hircilactis TaxID=1494462 RepID=A0A7X1Z8H6_9LACT|nr:23S rRNA (uracil(1939)-C(5))-methyltransferase RlmD [Lactococcus hircilactis]MQW38430.1 23S rRNA (uracil(1939)-C(5))-methyltransferase RlmD [Lactococcus hircilactis]
MNELKKNRVFETEVLDLSHEGYGVVKIGGFPLFVENALPGETIEVRVTKIGKSYGYGRLEKIIIPSEFRKNNIDLDYLRTGIADFGHMTYEAQLRFKQKQVVEVLHKIAPKEEFSVLPIIAAPEATKYRNKAQVPVRAINGQLETGFFRKNSHQLIPITDFYIQNPEIDQLIAFIRDELRKLGSANKIAYDEEKRRGWLRNIVIRRAHHTGEMMLVLVVTSPQFPFDKTEFLSVLTENFDTLKSIQLNINTSNGSYIFGKKWEILFGQATIEDTMLGKKFQISAPAFYQVNTAQAEKLYQTAYDFAELKKTDHIVDAYSGIGTIGLCVADQVSQVYGMEVISEAVENAKINANLNNLHNINYVTGTAEHVMAAWLADGISPDVIFVDPPRKGLDEQFIEAATQMNARTLIYISCNPATFARDVVRLKTKGYELKLTQPVDLFPQTHHIEVVGQFIKH